MVAAVWFVTQLGFLGLIFFAQWYWEGRND